MYEIVITCLVCGAVHSISHVEEQLALDDAEVLAQAKHSPDCVLLQSGNGKVQQETREHEPFVVLYTIEEAH